MAQRKTPSQVRRNNPRVTSVLPADGPDQAAPKWPLELPPTKAEKARWVHLWGLPVAELWHAWRCESVVARYCRMVVRAESLDGLSAGTGVAWQIQTRLLESELGLTPKAAAAMGLGLAPSRAEAGNQVAQLAAYRAATGDAEDAEAEQDG